MIRVASYNMRKAVGTDRRRSPERVIDVLNEIGADVIALQEADRRFGARASALPAHLLEEHSAYRPVPLPHRTGGIGWHGNAILVHKDVEIELCEALHIPALEPRGAVMAELRVNGESLRTIGMHLDLSGLWRKRQVKAIVDHLRRRHRDMPTVMMGDTNEWRQASASMKAFGDGYRSAPTGPSFHSRRPVATLDRILVCNSLKIEAAGVHASEEAKKASDHLPVWARIAL